jgi:flagellar protein FlgJ
MRSSARTFAADDSAAKDPVAGDLLDMADKLIADQLAGRHAFGVADALLRQLVPAAPAATASIAPLNGGPAPVALHQQDPSRPLRPAAGTAQ